MLKFIKTSIFEELFVVVSLKNALTTYDFFLAPFFLKLLGFLPQVIGSQVISTRRGILPKNNNNYISSIFLYNRIIKTS
jgi:hypothetical protein